LLGVPTHLHLDQKAERRSNQAVATNAGDDGQKRSRAQAIAAINKDSQTRSSQPDEVKWGSRGWKLAPCNDLTTPPKWPPRRPRGEVPRFVNELPGRLPTRASPGMGKVTMFQRGPSYSYRRRNHCRSQLRVPTPDLMRHGKRRVRGRDHIHHRH